MNNCDLLINNRCTKYRKNGKCQPSSLEWCDEEMKVIEADQMCRYASIFGNNYFYITEEQIEALKSGKVLYDGGEYGTFICLKGGKDET